MSVIEPFIWIAWDLLAVFILFGFVQKCAHRGFLSTIVSFFMYFAGSLVALYTYKRIAQFLYDNIVYDIVRSTLTRNLNLAFDSASGGVSSVTGAIPAILRVLMGYRIGMVGDISADSAEAMAAEIIEVALSDPLMSILNTVGFLLAFIIVAFFMRYLSGFFSGVNNVPIIGAVNTVLGGIMGVLEGVISLMVSSLLIHLLITFSGEMWWINDKVIDSTYIWRLFY